MATTAISAATNIDSIRVQEQGSTPSNPPTGYWQLYAKSDGLYYLEDDGTEVGPLAAAGGGAPTDATYIVQTANGSLSNEQALDALSDGLLKHSSGVVAQAVSNTDYAAATHASRHAAGGADEIDGDGLDIDYSASNYTPAATTVAGHFEGIDDALAGAGGVTVVIGNKTHKFGSSQTTSSNTMVDVDATNASVAITNSGTRDSIVTCTFRGVKVSSGSAFYRITDGTNSSDEYELETGAGQTTITLTWVVQTSITNPTYKLQYRSDNGNNASVNSQAAFQMTVTEIA